MSAKTNGIPLDTIVTLNPSKQNGLKRESYVDCNDYHALTPFNMNQKVTYKLVDEAGLLEKHQFEAVLLAITLSPEQERHVQRECLRILGIE